MKIFLPAHQSVEKRQFIVWTFEHVLHSPYQIRRFLVEFSIEHLLNQETKIFPENMIWMEN